VPRARGDLRKKGQHTGESLNETRSNGKRKVEVQVAVSKGPYDEVTLAELKAHDEVCQRIASIVDNLDGMTADDTRQWWQTCIVPDNSYALADEWASALREMGFKVKIELRTRAF
jgi:hypothetical protein